MKVKSIIVLFAASTIGGHAQNTLFKSPEYTLYSDSVVQGTNRAYATPNKELHTTYQSSYVPVFDRKLEFKVSINGVDNELKPGLNHSTIIIPKNGSFTTRIVFDRPDPEGTAGTIDTLEYDIKFRLEADLRHVIEAIKNNKFYISQGGQKITEIKDVYGFGSKYPFNWYDKSNPEVELKDQDKDGIYSIDMIFNPRKPIPQKAKHWRLTKDISKLPSYHSSQLLIDALYNQALEEVLININPKDNTFNAGIMWPDTWTRDISYSVYLALAFTHPEICKNSLLKKTKNKRIVQDTGTGGSYPVSTDRTVWTLAAWEIYKITGDEAWLNTMYEIVKNSVDDDILNIVDKETGLWKGESSYLDWREQTYPKWMQPLDIYNSECLGTNALHYNSLKTLCEMSKILKKPCEQYERYAQNIKDGVNKYLWMNDKRYYGQYLYGKSHMTLSPRSEVLGEALSVLVGIASTSQAEDIVSNTPILPFGASMIYPNIVDVKTYHNNSNWPFVQAYFNLACAKLKHTRRLNHGMASIYRAAAFFGTNKENFTIPSGDAIETEINAVNSDVELWSIAANLTNVYRIFFGMNLYADSISFNPFVPKEYIGQKTLKNVRYRNSRLDITVNGFGSSIEEFIFDGKPMQTHSLPSSITGNHTLVINLGNELPGEKPLNITSNHFTLITPKATVSPDQKSINWATVKGAKNYEVFLNGSKIGDTKSNTWPISREASYKSYQVRAIDDKDFSSFLTEPITVYSPKDEIKVNLSKAPKLTEKTFLNLTTKENTSVPINLSIEKEGWYFIDFYYANGNGTIESENKAGIRTLIIEDEKFPIIFPQRGINAWENFGYTNSAKKYLKKGNYTFTLKFLPENNNMNVEVNDARVTYMRAIYSGPK